MCWYEINEQSKGIELECWLFDESPAEDRKMDFINTSDMIRTLIQMKFMIKDIALLNKIYMELIVANS